MGARLVRLSTNGPGLAAFDGGGSGAAPPPAASRGGGRRHLRRPPALGPRRAAPPRRRAAGSRRAGRRTSRARAVARAHQRRVEPQRAAVEAGDRRPHLDVVAEAARRRKLHRVERLGAEQEAALGEERLAVGGAEQVERRPLKVLEVVGVVDDGEAVGVLDVDRCLVGVDVGRRACAWWCGAGQRKWLRRRKWSSRRNSRKILRRRTEGEAAMAAKAVSIAVGVRRDCEAGERGAESRLDAISPEGQNCGKTQQTLRVRNARLPRAHLPPHVHRAPRALEGPLVAPARVPHAQAARAAGGALWRGLGGGADHHRAEELDPGAEGLARARALLLGAARDRGPQGAAGRLWRRRR